jgi:hypothetical protein
MPPCHWCGVRPAFSRSHVVSDFIIRWLKRQSVWGAIYYTWAKNFNNKQIVGPYFCRDCDNQVTGAWEKQYSQDVFPDPMAATHQWGLDASIKFIVSFCYRCAMHNLRVSPHQLKKALNEQFRDVARAALHDPSLLGNHLFVDPYILAGLTQESSAVPSTHRWLRWASGIAGNAPSDANTGGSSG